MEIGGLSPLIAMMHRPTASLAAADGAADLMAVVAADVTAKMQLELTAEVVAALAADAAPGSLVDISV